MGNFLGMRRHRHRHTALPQAAPSRATINVTANANVGAGTSAAGSQYDTVNESVVAGEIDHYSQSKAFRGGNLSNVFGEISIDLSSAELADGVQSLALNTVFGNVKVGAARRHGVRAGGKHRLRRSND